MFLERLTPNNNNDDNSRNNNNSSTISNNVSEGIQNLQYLKVQDDNFPISGDHIIKLGILWYSGLNLNE